MKLRRRDLWVVAVVSFIGLPVFEAAAQNVVSWPAARDNTLYEHSTGAVSNGSGSHFFAGRNNRPQDSIRRGLIAFDLIEAVPPGAKIDSVTLQLHMSRTNAGAGEHTINLHRVLAPWGEGVSDAQFEEGGGAPATGGDATWVHTFFDTTMWTTVGGDFSPTISAGQAVADTGFYAWGSTAGMVSDVQAWVDNPLQNFGWILLGDEAAGQSAKRFDSREHETAAYRPVLHIYFSTSTGVADRAELVPAGFALAEVYPNPLPLRRLLNGGATLDFVLATTARINLKIYNILGQEVVTLADSRPFQAGRHAIRWNGRDVRGLAVAPGVYFSVLQVGGRISAQTITILR